METIHTFTNDAYGISALVKKNPNGTFSVVLKDDEAGEYLPSILQIKDEALAVRHAKRLVA